MLLVPSLGWLGPWRAGGHIAPRKVLLWLLLSAVPVQRSSLRGTGPTVFSPLAVPGSGSSAACGSAEVHGRELPGSPSLPEGWGFRVACCLGHAAGGAGGALGAADAVIGAAALGGRGVGGDGLQLGHGAGMGVNAPERRGEERAD